MAGRSFAGLLGTEQQEPAPVTVTRGLSQETPALEALAVEKANKYGLDPALFTRQIHAESSFNPQAVSPAGAQGLGQLMPGTARDLGVTNPFDPEQNLEASARYMAQLKDRYKGNMPAAIAAYNWGMGNVDRKGLKNAPKETRDYMAKILGNAQEAAMQPVREAPARQALASAQGRSFAGLLGEQQQQQPAEEQGFWDRTAELSRRIDAGMPLEPGGEQPEKLGNWGTYASRFGRGMSAPVRGIQQAANMLIPDAAERAMNRATGAGDKTFNQRMAEDEAAYQQMLRQQGQTGFDWAGIAGNVASPVSLALGAMKAPAALAKAPQALRWLGKMATPAAAQAVVQPVFGPNQGEPTMWQFAKEKAKQAGAGAAGGIVGGGIASGLANVGGKVAGALQGKVQPAAQEMLDLANQHNIPITASNIDEPRRALFRRAQQLAERIPVGLDASAQRGAIAASAQSKVDESLEAMRKLPFTNLKDVQKVAEGTSKRAATARYVLGLVDDAGEDWKKIVRASGNLKALRMKLQSDRNYDELGAALGNRKQVEPISLVRTLANLQRAESGQIRPTRTLSNMLARYQNQLDSEDFVPTWDSMRQLRTALNQEVNSITKPGVKEPAGYVNAYKSMIAAINGDLDRFASNHPNQQVRQLWKGADDFYKKHVLPFEERELANTLKDVDTDSIWARFVASDDVTHQRRMWKALDERGRAAVRYGIIKEKVDEAFNPSLGTVDPIKLSNSINKLKTTTSIYFDPASKAKLDGFTKLLGHLKHATEPEGGQFGYNIGYGGALGALLGFTGPAGAAAGIGAGVGLKQLLTTERGLKILFAANLAKQGSERMQHLTNEALKLATEAGAEAAGAQAGRQAPNIIERAQQAGTALGGQSAGRVVGGSPPVQNRRERKGN